MKIIFKYSEDQPRDYHGRWSATGNTGFDINNEEHVIQLANTIQGIISDEGVNSTKYGDNILYNMAKIRGFTGTPTLISKDEMDAKVVAGSKDLYRGLTRYAGNEPEYYCKQFQVGDYYAGRGIIGNGIYIGDIDIASTFGTSNANSIIRMIFKENAKIVNMNELDKLYKNLIFLAKTTDAKANRYAIEGNTRLSDRYYKLSDGYLFAGRDLGTTAIAYGYDAINSEKYGCMVILNRTALYVQDELIYNR